MKFSTSIAHLAQALSTFQAMVANVKKEATNPHFKSKYASLDEIITTIRPYMEKTGLSFIQNPVKEEGCVGVSTIILHKSGEFIECDAVLIPLKQDTAHGVGAAMTYARRYSLGAAFGIATEEDDDGNNAGTPPKKTYNNTNNYTSKYETKKPSTPTKPLPNSWSKLAEENLGRSVEETGLERKRFFAICGKKNLTDKQQKAIVFLHTGELSRKNVTPEQYREINHNIQDATYEELYHMVVQALQQFKKGDVVNG